MTFKIRLVPDKHHLPLVARLPDGRQVWIDVQVAAGRDGSRDFVACYVFEPDGRLADHHISDMGLRDGGDSLARNADWRQPHVEAEIRRLQEMLGPATLADIRVFPFTVEAHGVVFGLGIQEMDDPEMAAIAEEDGPFVDVLPGYTLMFHPPWEEGGYDS